MSCPYSDKELDYWDGACNPMGKACYDCEDYACEHNLNPDPGEPWFDPYELEKDMGQRASEEPRAQVGSPQSPARLKEAGMRSAMKCPNCGKPMVLAETFWHKLHWWCMWCGKRVKHEIQSR